jgi:integrase
MFTHDNVPYRQYYGNMAFELIPGSAGGLEPRAGKQEPAGEPPTLPAALSTAQAELRAMTLAAVPAANTRRAYGKAVDDLFAFAAGRPLSRPLLIEFRASMETLATPTINLRLSGVRKLVSEAARNGLLSREDAAELADVPNLPDRGTRLGNWLTKEQARELLRVPDRATLKGKRDYVILALLVACGLLREGRWVLADLRGKGGRVRTVAVPLWVRQGIEAWTSAASIEEGKLLRRIGRGGAEREGTVRKQPLGAASIRLIVEQAAADIGIVGLAPHDLRRTCAKLCRKAGGDLEQIKFLLGHSSIQTTERYLGSEQDIAIAVNDSIGL